MYIYACRERAHVMQYSASLRKSRLRGTFDVEGKTLHILSLSSDIYAIYTAQASKGIQ